MLIRRLTVSNASAALAEIVALDSSLVDLDQGPFCFSCLVEKPRKKSLARFVPY